MNVLPLAVKYHHSTVVVVRKLYAVLLQQPMQQIRTCKAEVACYYQIIVSGCCACILQKPFDRVGSGRGKCQENTIKFLEKFFQTIKFGKLWVLPWEPIMFYTINQ